MGRTKISLLFNEDNEKQKTVCDFLKSQDRYKTAIITDLVYQWLENDKQPLSGINIADMDEIKEKLLSDPDFISLLKEKIAEEEDSEEDIDMDEDLLLAGFDMFANSVD